jgi:hypothetical protein
MMKKVFIFLLLVGAICLVMPVNQVYARTQVPYETYTEDAKGRLVVTQHAYVPGASFSHASFRNIREIHVYNDYVFVLDQSDYDNRIVVFDDKHDYVALIDLPDTIYRAEGFYLTEDRLYIADSGLNKEGSLFVYAFDYETYALEELNRFGKPRSPLFGEDTPFIPMKVVVDSRNNLYIVSDGALNGVVQMSESGRFFGFFGANKSDVPSLRAAFQIFFPSRSRRVLPPTPTNLALDREGYVYTVTEGLSGTGLKKFNVASRNFLPEDLNVIQGNIAVTAGKTHNVFTLNSNGTIREYDFEGNMLFSFGGTLVGDQRRGLFQSPISLAVDQRHRILVADNVLNQIQIMERTDFAERVHLAIDRFLENDFEQGIDIWNDILFYNAWFELAYKGIGDAYMSEGNYREAMDAYYKTGDIECYSDAFWELRNNAIDDFIGAFVIIFFSFQFFLWFKYAYNKKGHKILPEAVHDRYQKTKKKTWFKQAFKPFKIIFHPLDAFHDIKRQNDTSMVVATAIYLMVAGAYLIRILVSNYIFVGAIEDQNIFLDLLLLYGGLSIFVVMNFLVCSIREGSGFFREIYIGTAYVILPVILVVIIMSVASVGLTLNEAFIYDYVHSVTYVWSGVLLYFMVKDIYDYEVGETFMNLGITLFSMLVVIFVGFVGYVVVNQSLTFFGEIIREAIYRVQGF